MKALLTALLLTISVSTYAQSLTYTYDVQQQRDRLGDL